MFQIRNVQMINKVQSKICVYVVCLSLEAWHFVVMSNSTELENTSF